MILIKMIKGFLKKPITILKSIYLRLLEQNQQLVESRLAICDKCKDKLYYMGDYVCGHCGCVLENKTRLDNEHCDLGKW